MHTINTILIVGTAYNRFTPCANTAVTPQDTRRLLAVGVDSVFVTGPALHTLYEFLERLVPTNTGGFLPAAFHVLVDTFVFDPIFVASFFCTTGLLESRSLKEDILPALRR